MRTSKVTRGNGQAATKAKAKVIAHTALFFEPQTDPGLAHIRKIKEAIGGYIIIKAGSIDEAAEISKDCPILAMGGNVEVRTIVPMD